MSQKQTSSDVYIIFGPTGVGKTEFLKKKFDKKIEVINCDSMQVYKFLDIGTAKPSPDILNLIPHHLIDVVTPDIQFNVSDFINLAEKKIDEILARGNLPVLCGGTAYYIKNFLFGMAKAPASDRAISKKIEQEIKSDKRDYYYNLLKKIDPIYSKKININDTYRLTRAIEVYQISGKPLSFFSIPETIRDDYNFKIFEFFRPKEELHRRIETRVDKMFDLGLEREIKNLFDMGYDFNSPGMKAIGYKEWATGKNSSEVKKMVIQNSRQYAKRQITFFKLIPNKVIIDISSENFDNFLPL